MIIRKEFDSSLLKIDKEPYKNMAICYADYITIKENSKYDKFVNLLYLTIHGWIGYFEEKNGRKHLALSPDNKLMDKYKEVWRGIKTGSINGDKEFKNEKKNMKIKFDSDDDLPLNKLLKFPTVTIIVTSAFEDDGKFYPQMYRDDCLYYL